eukprot:NODE_488_length_1349_cov_659.530769_g354_i0.p1 GENE.NODE_488_length_1349_cov_659.530769_g354_i0~~NODE_488_length_1349_cov_659.530769_g354_i0.p1  ORF type:complete len:370 (+),score=101.24 NODE_488_length_1349_cov_659.530769_g354_i0:58-1167(+)
MTRVDEILAQDPLINSTRFNCMWDGLCTSMTKSFKETAQISDSPCNFHRRRHARKDCPQCTLNQLDWFDRKHKPLLRFRPGDVEGQASLSDSATDDDEDYAATAAASRMAATKSTQKGASRMETRRMTAAAMRQKEDDASEIRLAMAARTARAQKEAFVLYGILRLRHPAVRKFAETVPLTTVSHHLRNAQAGYITVGRDSEMMQTTWLRVAEDCVDPQIFPRHRLLEMYHEFDKDNSQRISIGEVFLTMHTITQLSIDPHALFKHFFGTQCLVSARRMAADDADSYVTKLELYTLLNCCAGQEYIDPKAVAALRVHLEGPTWATTPSQAFWTWQRAMHIEDPLLYSCFMYETPYIYIPAVPPLEGVPA